MEPPSKGGEGRVLVVVTRTHHRAMGSDDSDDCAGFGHKGTIPLAVTQARDARTACDVAQRPRGAVEPAVGPPSPLPPTSRGPAAKGRNDAAPGRQRG